MYKVRTKTGVQYEVSDADGEKMKGDIAFRNATFVHIPDPKPATLPKVTPPEVASPAKTETAKA